jgi:uncharacterized lipoprotein YbaY
MRYLKILLLIIFLTVSCATTADYTVSEPVYNIISGTVLYPNNLYFPARVRLEIALKERNDNTSAFNEVVSQSIRNPQRFPVNFILRYDKDDISRSKEYYISVELFKENEDIPYLESKLTHLPPLSGNESIIIELERIK